ncbi:A24 family peptidase [Nocardia jinanensis]|uniref:Prepilin peptidase n=1 Tax=Nocardia jinanensis TaxID=382504 RepID=A0A917R7X2_9NOCA|nr:A24 family peptidase [Nocardia jinanensis]GGK93847.1 prepilin peptidase [Nocardia jinanensis]
MTTLGFLALTAWCAVLSISDIRSRRLPNPLTLSGAAAVLGYAALTGQFLTAGRSAALLAVPYLLIHLVRPAALGAGDVKLAIGLGAAAGLGGDRAWVWSALVAPVCTAVAGAGALLGHWAGRRISGGRRRTADPRAPVPGHPGPGIPHGPSMCAATLLGLALW